MAKKKTITITQVKSCIGRLPKHKKTIKALGFTKLNQTLVKEATPQILGMIKKVDFMLKVEDATK